MKKNKITLGILSSLMACAALASCGENVTKGTQGAILTLTDSNGSGEKINVTADELFTKYLSETSGVSKEFDSVYELLVRTEFKKDKYAADLADIDKRAKVQVQAIKEQAQDNKEENNSDYQKELDKLLKEKGVDSLEELFNYFQYQGMKSKFEEKFYKENIEAIRDGSAFTGKDGYLKEKIPYHVKHILVKVGAGSNEHSRATIEAAEATKLSNVVRLLANPYDAEEHQVYDFGKIAKELSEDEGSAANFGDLGIMDKDTSFVNEFKLGIYAYDSIYNADTVAKKDLIGMRDSDITYFTDTAEIGQIPYGVFEKLGKVANIETDADNFVVNGGQKEFFPRNVYFNKYLNKHSIAVIVPNDLPTDADLEALVNEEGKAASIAEPIRGAYNADYAALPNFKSVNFTDAIALDAENTEKKVLCDESGKVILVVRAGTSSYQGIHFIVVERSALVETVKNIEHNEDISLAQYYTTYYPSDENIKDGKYPTYADDSTPMDTYINYNKEAIKDYKTRAEELESTIKSYEPLINTYIYEKLAEGITFHEGQGKAIQEAIQLYISAQRNYNDFTNKETWEQTWDTYEEYLDQQEEQRVPGKLLSEVCAIKYTDPKTGKFASAFSKGGMCGYDSGK